jgi:hypothetical protein
MLKIIPEGTPQSPHSLRPCWMMILSILRGEMEKHADY